MDDSGDSADLQALFDNIASSSPPEPPPAPAPARPAPAPAAGKDSGDSAELEDLFDSVAAESKPPAPTPPPPAPKPSLPPPAAASATGDSPELEALFDSMTSESAAPAAAAGGEPPGDEDLQEVVFNKLGHLTRKLYEDMRELGVDKAVEEGVRQVPDVRERLIYISKLTEQAAERVFNATDIVKPLEEKRFSKSTALGQRWEKMFANQLSVDEFKMLAAETRAYFQEAPAHHQAVNTQLTEITLAQDFQDLTGQVIKKVADIIQNLETQLLAVLIEAIPPQIKEEKAEVIEQSGLMNGPVINADGRSDIVTSQEQVDDLLESLGF